MQNLLANDKIAQNYKASARNDLQVRWAFEKGQTMQTTLFPALDLINGKVVRLFKGDYAKKQSYDFKPLDKLKEYENAGAKWLHLVDLDGAKEPKNRQISLIKSLCDAANVSVQVGGGIRSKADIKALLNAGASRVVIGSVAILNPELCVEILREFPAHQICLALDVLPKGAEFIVAVNAWQNESDKKLLEVIEFYAEHGLSHLLCTDISRDGTMSGANLRLYKLISEIFPNIEILASGGVNSLADLKNLKGVCGGVIVGKALLDGTFSVKDALACLR